MLKKLALAICITVLAFSLCGCQTSAPQTNVATDFELDDTFSYQGVTIPGNSEWTIAQPLECNYYIKLDKGNNSGISIQTALYGQTDTLANAWHEYTTAKSDPVEKDSWEKGGVEFTGGDWTNDAGLKYYMISGYDPSSKKGFLCKLSLSADTWSKEDSEALYEIVKDSITYDPSETTIDYKESYDASKEPKTSSPSDSNLNNNTPKQEETKKAVNYKAGSYRVGTDIPAGEYKLTCSGSHGYYCVYPDSSKSEILSNGNFTTCTYTTVSDGQLLETRGSTFVAITNAQATAVLNGQGIYKVGLDIAPGEYNLIASGDQGYYAILSTVDASTSHNIVDNDNFEGNSFISISDGQYLEISRVSIGS